MKPRVKLTKRQAEIAELLFSAKTVKQIADGLGITYKTCDCHISHLYARLNVNSRMGVIMWLKSRKPHRKPRVEPLREVNPHA